MASSFARLLERAASIDTGVTQDPVILMRFLRGAEFGDPRWVEPLGAATFQLAREFNCTWSLDAGSLCSLFCETRKEAVQKLISTIESNIEKLVPSVVQDSRTTFIDLLPDLAARAPMYIGGWRATDAFIFFEGYAAACELNSVSVEEERAILNRLQSYIHEQTGLPGRWDRVLEVLDGGRGRSIEQFVEGLSIVCGSEVDPGHELRQR